MLSRFTVEVCQLSWLGLLRRVPFLCMSSLGPFLFHSLVPFASIGGEGDGRGCSLVITLVSGLNWGQRLFSLLFSSVGGG